MKFNDLHKIVKAKNIRQVDIIDACNLSKGTVQKILNGEIESVKLDSIIKVAEYLGIPVTYYFTDTPAQVNEAPAEYSLLLRELVATKDKLNKNQEAEIERLKQEVADLRAQKKGFKCV